MNKGCGQFKEKEIEMAEKWSILTIKLHWDTNFHIKDCLKPKGLIIVCAGEGVNE